MSETLVYLKIGQSDLLNFAMASGIAQQTIVRSIKYRSDYDPRTDYWKPLRDCIKKMHRADEPMTVLDDLCRHVPAKKQANYERAVKVYKRFLNGKDLEWFKPIRRDWQHGDLQVRINPELGLMINGTPHIIKLYFSDEKLTKDKAAGIIQLMETTLQSYHPQDTVYSILDVPRNKLLTIVGYKYNMMPSIRAYATAFVHMYNEL